MVIGATLYSGTILYNSINQCMFIPTLIRLLNNKKINDNRYIDIDIGIENNVKLCLVK